jgi:cell division FtsZ-interacting protein ZapD
MQAPDAIERGLYTGMEWIHARSDVLIAKPNRKNARKNKPGGSCRMCKPHKHKWEHKFKVKTRARLNAEE